ncbi:hypothetical protein Pelo_7482 [Pelomyxa schiedti]|nr:hypothetical protein Pelo_7482 [Pelomyxa schiedti]
MMVTRTAALVVTAVLCVALTYSTEAVESEANQGRPRCPITLGWIEQALSSEKACAPGPDLDASRCASALDLRSVSYDRPCLDCISQHASASQHPQPLSPLACDPSTGLCASPPSPLPPAPTTIKRACAQTCFDSCYGTDSLPQAQQHEGSGGGSGPQGPVFPELTWDRECSCRMVSPEAANMATKRKYAVCQLTAPLFGEKRDHGTRCGDPTESFVLLCLLLAATAFLAVQFTRWLSSRGDICGTLVYILLAVFSVLVAAVLSVSLVVAHYELGAEPEPVLLTAGTDADQFAKSCLLSYEGLHQKMLMTGYRASSSLYLFHDNVTELVDEETDCWGRIAWRFIHDAAVGPVASFLRIAIFVNMAADVVKGCGSVLGLIGAKLLV